MASYLDKFKIKTAVSDHTKLDLSCQHITTSDFFQLNPIYIKEMVPGERIEINTESFTRLAPMAVPTFGRVKMKNRAFFVPMRTVWKGWNDFITDTTHVTANQTADVNLIGSQVPMMYLADITTALISDNATYAYTVGSGDAYDLSVKDDNEERLYKLTPKGRQVVKILQALGYQITNQIGQSDELVHLQVSALPLLSFAKIYLDWYFSSAYYDSVERTNIERILKRDTSVNGTQLTTVDLIALFKAITSVNYDSDYFTSAFNNPVGPVNGSYSVETINDVTEPYNATNGKITNENSSNGTPYFQTPNSRVISQYALDALKSLTDYMKRHQLVGARALDRYLARFGKSLSSEKLDRSNYIDSQEVNIQIGDVMSNAETGSSMSNLLGGFAGKGIGYDSKSFDYETDEYGYLIILSSIVPSVGYYQGMDRMVTHTSRLDFFTPEFDQLGNQAIKCTELWMPEMNDLTFAGNLNGYESDVFGWTPRYAEYKIGRDKLTGDFRVPTLNVVGDTSDSWHLMRKIEPTSLDDLVISQNFVKGDIGSTKQVTVGGVITTVDVPSQYDRIFSYVDNKSDHFYCIHNFNVISWSPMKSLYDTYDFDGGKDIVADVNGVKVN